MTLELRKSDFQQVSGGLRGRVVEGPRWRAVFVPRSSLPSTHGSRGGGVRTTQEQSFVRLNLLLYTTNTYKYNLYALEEECMGGLYK